MDVTFCPLSLYSVFYCANQFRDSACRVSSSCVQWPMPAIQTPRKLRQEDCKLEDRAAKGACLEKFLCFPAVTEKDWEWMLKGEKKHAHLEIISHFSC